MGAWTRPMLSPIHHQHDGVGVQLQTRNGFRSRLTVNEHAGVFFRRKWFVCTFDEKYDTSSQ